MKRTIAILAAVLLAAGCATKSSTSQNAASSGSLVITTTVSPDPPKKGNETLTVTLKDASGAAVKGAAVKIASSMPKMSMSGPSAVAIDNGNGTYTSTIPLRYATRWVFAITASSAAKTAHATVAEDVR